MSGRVVPATIYVLLLALGLNLNIINSSHTIAEAAHARRTSSHSSSTTSSSSEYDKRITTIDPSGRLLQVEYAMEAAHRRSATSASALLATENDLSSSVNDDDSNLNIGIMVYISNHHEGGGGGTKNNHNHHRRKLHRIDSGTIGISSGLDGDGRLLVGHLRNISHRESHYKSKTDRRNSKEDRKDGDCYIDNSACDVRVLARECGKVQHQLTLTAGARPLGVSITLLGLLPPTVSSSSLPTLLDGEESSTAHSYHRHHRRSLGLFHCEAGGMTVDSCECTASGMGRDQVRVDIVKLLRNLKLSGDSEGMTDYIRASSDEVGDGGGDDSSSSRNTKVVTRFVKGVAEIVLKRYLEHGPSSKQDSSSIRNSIGRTKGDDRANESTSTIMSTSTSTSTLVDIYLVKPNSKCRGGVQISCALSVPECDLDRVANLFAADVSGV